MYRNRLLSIAAATSGLLLQVYADGAGSTIYVADSAIGLSINTVPGVYYQVQYCSDLKLSEWRDLGPIFRAETGFTIRKIDAKGPNGFFRVVIVENIPLPPVSEPPLLPLNP